MGGTALAVRVLIIWANDPGAMIQVPGGGGGDRRGEL